MNGSGQTPGTRECHVKAVKEKNFRAGVERERNGWGHEINGFHGRICQEIERSIHTKSN